jgi:hypothetical protein
MAAMRDYTDAELEIVRQSFGGRSALRDRCYREERHGSGEIPHQS